MQDPFARLIPDARAFLGDLAAKGLTVWRDLPAARINAPQSAMSDLFDALQPLLNKLQQVRREARNQRFR